MAKFMKVVTMWATVLTMVMLPMVCSSQRLSTPAFSSYDAEIFFELAALDLTSSPESRSLSQPADDTVRQMRQDPPCQPFRLNETECYYVLGNEPVLALPFRPSQEQLWDEMKMQVSDSRMLPSSCRRGLLWFACTATYLPCREGAVCPPSMSACEEVNLSCVPYGIELNCSALPPQTAPSCVTNLTHQEAVATPLPVKTCLSNTTTEVECCPDPYTVESSTGECVVACYQYGFTESKERALYITCFVIVWLSSVLMILTLGPVVHLMKLRFPNYVILIYIIMLNMWGHISLWSVYGGVENYICDGHEEHTVGLASFLNSARCIVQGSMLDFIIIAGTMWQLVFSLHILSQSLR